jgi:hypothetical protein
MAKHDEQSEALVPCLIDRGVIFKKKDIIRLLQGLDHIEYTEMLNGSPIHSRQGFIVEIFEDPAEASLFFNRRIHINVNSFEYIKVNYNFPQEATNQPQTEAVGKSDKSTAQEDTQLVGQLENVNIFNKDNVSSNQPIAKTGEQKTMQASVITEAELGKVETPKIEANNYSIEMFMAGGRSITVRPLNDPIDNPGSLISEVEERRRVLTEWEEVTADADDD